MDGRTLAKLIAMYVIINISMISDLINKKLWDEYTSLKLDLSILKKFVENKNREKVELVVNILIFRMN